ncbi:hypothetical protein ANO14919_023850 [Xylariales sp. No.14919]|nr:hypothetical protein ANO14919_023850 [Xylariales sp. No.14919]
MVCCLGVRFRRESVNDYVGVLVPLEEAHLHSYSARRRKADAEDQHGSGDADANADPDHNEDEEAALGATFKSSNNEGDAMLQVDAPEYSIDGLRQAVREGEPGRRWTEYELKSKLINKAIQDIGMGLYNWQLFVLCGFGWFADNLWMQVSQHGMQHRIYPMSHSSRVLLTRQLGRLFNPAFPIRGVRRHREAGQIHH